MRGLYPRTFGMIPQLTEANRVVIDTCILGFLLDMPHYHVNCGLLTVLIEQWHNDHNTFYLTIGEITVTPEDVYRIICISVMGELVVYDVEEKGGTQVLRQFFGDLEIIGYDISW